MDDAKVLSAAWLFLSAKKQAGYALRRVHRAIRDSIPASNHYAGSKVKSKKDTDET